jgi:hypothetical protein
MFSLDGVRAEATADLDYARPLIFEAKLVLLTRRKHGVAPFEY